LPLLARSFNDYDIDELNKFRETTKYMSDFYQEIDQFENTENNVLENNNLNIQSKLEALNTKVSPRYAKTKEYVQRIFVDKEKNESKTNYTGQQFYSFFSSFLT
jgi:hypothetical protein